MFPAYSSLAEILALAGCAIPPAVPFCTSTRVSVWLDETQLARESSVPVPRLFCTLREITTLRIKLQAELSRV